MGVGGWVVGLGGRGVGVGEAEVVGSSVGFSPVPVISGKGVGLLGIGVLVGAGSVRVNVGRGVWVGRGVKVG